jgi:hypothetical protein
LRAWAKAGDAKLIAASVAIRASFDLLIIVFLQFQQPKTQNAVIAVAGEMGLARPFLIGEPPNRLSTQRE